MLSIATYCALRSAKAIRPGKLPLGNQWGAAWLFSTTSSSAEDAVPSVKLYQYAICPFCNIVKAAMAYTSVQHQLVEVNPLTKAELKWSKDYKKVPVAIVDGNQLNGSMDIVKGIIEHPKLAPNLENRLKEQSREEFMESSVAKKWAEFAQEDLASLLYPNICRTWGDSYKAFGYIDSVGSFSTFQKLSIKNVGSLAMYFAASKIKSKRNITDEKQALDEVLSQLEEGLNGERVFLSGKDEPNLGDVAVYGTLRSIEGLPAHEEAIYGRDPASPLRDWYQRMKAQVEPSK